jgi:proline iminopeptidase
MVEHRSLRVSALLISFTCIALIGADLQAQERESIFDGVVHIETGVLTEIPATPRLEEGLSLTVRRIDVGGAELYVEEEGSGTPIVLINGGPGGTHHYFHPWFGRASKYARVIYYDQRGTGLSDFRPGEDGYSVDQAVADLDAIRTTLGIDQWVLVGFSYGGFLAQYYTTTHPQNVAGLVLVGASPGMWTELGGSRQYDYITEAEIDKMRDIRATLREAREQEGWSREQYIQLLIYNNHINGDWKRQSFYRPTMDEFAQMALYEWVNDTDFNSIVNQSANRVDLTGAFDNNPIPTLILEGKWDLTWGDPKPTILSRNHPSARMVVIEGAGHSIYSENPDAFFSELESFVTHLPPVADSDIEAYGQRLAAWRSNWKDSPLYYLKVGWGMSGSQQIAAGYEPDWLDEITSLSDLLRIGFALYDTEKYQESLNAFVKLGEIAEAEGSQNRYALALIWQGHMLDLLGRRQAAIDRYQSVVDMKLEGGIRHDQYGLSYEYSPYAAERLQTPFTRVENSSN